MIVLLIKVNHMFVERIVFIICILSLFMSFLLVDNDYYVLQRDCQSLCAIVFLNPLSACSYKMLLSSSMRIATRPANSKALLHFHLRHTKTFASFEKIKVHRN